MEQEFSPINVAKAAEKLTEIARKSGYADWDGDSSELFIARAAKRLMGDGLISYEDAQKDIVQAVLTQRAAPLIT